MSYLFISYSRQNQIAIDRIIEALENHGYECWVDRKNIKVARKWRSELWSAIDNCEIFAIALSKSSINSKVVYQELIYAQQKSKPIVPIILQKINLPDKLSFLKEWQWIDLFSNYSKGLEDLKSAVPKAKIINREPPPQNIPRSGVSIFVGRESELERVNESLQSQQKIAVSSLSGMGGLGKTELAIQYAQRYWYKTYRGGVCWLRARNQDIGLQLVAFAITKLNMNIPKDLSLIQQVQWCWVNWPSQESVLVVFDDVTHYQDIEGFLPPAGVSQFKVLITTRLQHLFTPITSIQLELLPQQKAKELLGSFIGSTRLGEEDSEANMLCQWLGYLPLGIELVGQYLRQRIDLKLSQMLVRLEKNRLNQKALKNRQEGTTAQLDLSSAFELSWLTLSIEGQNLGCLLSLFALAPIPWLLVEQCFPEIDSEDLEDLRQEELINNSLLRRVDERNYQIHQLIREFFRQKIEHSAYREKLKKKLCKAILSLSQNISDAPNQQKISNTHITTIILHISEATVTLAKYFSNENFYLPLVCLGRFYSYQGAYEKARFWYEQCLSASKLRFGYEHEEVVSSLNNLANICRSMGLYKQANSNFNEALVLGKRILGDKHTLISTILSNFSLLHCEQGYPELAKPLLEEAIEIRKLYSNVDSLEFSNLYSNFAYLYTSLKKYDIAEQLLLEIIQTRRKYLGASHPEIATTLNNLAYVYENQERFEQAENLYRESMEIRKLHFSSDHLDIAQSLHNIGIIYAKQKLYERALPILRNALHIFEKHLDSQHPLVISCCKNINNISNDMEWYIY